MKLMYEEPSGQGRRGILDVGESARMVHKKIEDREKFFKFFDKYGKGVVGEDIRSQMGGATTFASLKDLV